MLGDVPGSHTRLAATVYRNKSSAGGQLPAGPQRRLPGTPCAPQPHTEQTGCPARTQQCLSCLGSHSTVDDLYNGLLPAILLCCFFSFFLHLLLKLRFCLLFPSPLPSLLLLNSFLGLGRVSQAHLHECTILQVSHILSEWNKKQLYTKTTASMHELS